MPVIYDTDKDFPVGGSKVLRRSGDDAATIAAAGVTLHEALAAADLLAQEDIRVMVVDLYCIKPVDAETLRQAAHRTGLVLTVEDHYPEGGLADAVRTALADIPTPVYSLAVAKKPLSGKPDELLDYEGISHAAIAGKIRELLRK
mgnify:CR=1 FL=1